MSQQPSPKQSFIQTLLLMAVLFLGFNMFCAPREPDKRPLPEIMSSIRKLHGQVAKGEGADPISTLKSEVGAFQNKLDRQGPGERLTKEQAEELRREAEVLSFDADLKEGVRTKNFNTVQMAYQMLHAQGSEAQKKPEWTKDFPVTPSEDFPRSKVNLKQLYSDLRERSQVLAKSEMVWGFMPGWQLLDALVKMTGAVPWFSYAFAALLLAVLVRGVVWPLAQKQYMWSRQMAQLGPLVKELREKYQGQELQMKTMELYQQYGINPMAGCGPMLLQMPLFILIYQCMLMYRFEFEKGTFLWVSPGSHDALGGFVAPNLGERDYILLVLYGLSMIATTLLAPVSDPANVKQQRLMGIGITVLFTVIMFTPIFPVPSAFVLYWIFTNLIATFQMLRAYRLPLPPLVKVQTKEGGVVAKNPVLRAMQEAQEKQAQQQQKPSANGQPKGTGQPKLHKPKKKKK